MNEALCQQLRNSYSLKADAIKSRLAEFRAVSEEASDIRTFEELCFCICTAGASARMGLRSVEAMRDILYDGSLKQLQRRLRGVHRFPNNRPAYIFHTREYLKRAYGFRLSDLIDSFEGSIERRDFLARNRDIKGIGYKEASHFLRNIGYTGYAILDKHILNILYETGILKSAKPPSNREQYLDTEERVMNFADRLGIDPDELDLLLWSEKTGEILK